MNVRHNQQKIWNFHKNRLVKLIPKKSHLPLSYKAASCCLIWRKVIQNMKFLHPHKKQPSSLRFGTVLYNNTCHIVLPYEKIKEPSSVATKVSYKLSIFLRHFLQKRDYQRYGEKAFARKFVHN